MVSPGGKANISDSGTDHVKFQNCDTDVCSASLARVRGHTKICCPTWMTTMYMKTVQSSVNNLRILENQTEC